MVAEGVGLAVDPPVMNEAGAPDRSPGDEHRNAAHVVIHHLQKRKYRQGVGLRVAIEREADHEVSSCEGGILRCHE